MDSLFGKTVFITGASRGIGKAIALRAAQDGANVVIAAKTVQPHPKLAGTIHSAAQEIEDAGGSALALAVDVRDEDAVEAAVTRAVERFGGIDILVNNASAISLTDTLHTPTKRFDLMLDVNLRGTWTTTRACLPHLLRAENPHILVLSPPLNLDPRWLAPHTAYTISKYGMSLCVLGLAEEFRERRVAVNALWPRTVIATAATEMLPGVDLNTCRRPDIVSDAAHWILTRPSHEYTGNFFIDEAVLALAGVTDFDVYAIDPSQPLLADLFLD
ncbi:SDR family oxidoreductase [Immundisolibacter sp.]|uniref:SDR family oxidoreductase n=1 Tax=Immundisolibacter sp. TaxID=1934948 RepID=UPI003563724E